MLDSTFDLQQAPHNFTQNFVLIGKLEILKFRGLEFAVGHRVGHVWVWNTLLHVWVVNHFYDDVKLFLLLINTIQIGASKTTTLNVDLDITRMRDELRAVWPQYTEVIFFVDHE